MDDNGNDDNQRLDNQYTQFKIFSIIFIIISIIWNANCIDKMLIVF